MKIQSAYLQNQIQDTAKPVRPVQNDTENQIMKLPAEQTVKQTDKAAQVKDRLELSEASKRILSSSEKTVFAELYQEYQLQHDQVYSRNGQKTGHPESAVGKKIDVKC